MRRRRNQKFKFTEKTISKIGIAALVMASLSLISCVVMLIAALRVAGTLSIYIACYGILAALLAIASLVIAIISLRDENTYRSIPYAATFLSVLSVLVWFAIYIGGIFA